MALAALAVAPWVFALLFFARPGGAALAVACGVFSLGCCLLIARRLRPILRTAADFKALAIADGADGARV